MKIFFYGLFMDEALLAEKGVFPSGSATGYLEGYALRIGDRATLLPSPGSQAYGVVMDVSREDAARLYSDASVADYVAEDVSVTLPDGSTAAACYNLPAEKLSGANAQYAAALEKLATRLGFPEAYLRQIRQAK